MSSVAASSRSATSRQAARVASSIIGKARASNARPSAEVRERATAASAYRLSAAPDVPGRVIAIAPRRAHTQRPEAAAARAITSGAGGPPSSEGGMRSMLKRGSAPWHLAVLLGVALAAGGSGSMAQVDTRGLVDDRRLLAANDDTDADWITFGQDYRNQRFSNLKGIDRANVARLAPAWIFQSGIVGSHQTHPLEVDGVMY